MGSFLSQERHDNTGITLTNHTWSNNLIADGGTGMVVGTNPQDPWDQMDDVTHYKNLFVAVNRTPNLNLGGEIEHINNIIYDSPFKNSRVFNESKINHIGNFYKRTNGSTSQINVDIITNWKQQNPQIYSVQNVYSGNSTSGKVEYDGRQMNNEDIWTNYSKGKDSRVSSKFFTDARHTNMNAMVLDNEIESAQDAYQNVVERGNVGAYKYIDDNGNVQVWRDTFDTEMLDVTRNNDNYTSKHPSNCVFPKLPENRRPSTYDSDNDGMADAWEIRKFGSLNESYRGDFDGDGYENIEEYMNQVDFN